MITSNSRYAGMDILSDADALPDGKTFLEIRRPLFSSATRGERGQRALPEERLDLRAWEEYGDARSWWAIAERNAIFNPRKDIKPGRVYMVPTMRVFQAKVSGE